MPPKTATRASTRTKATGIPTTTRMTRAAAKAGSSTPEPPAATAVPKKATSRKPLVNKNDEDIAKLPARAKPASKTKAVSKITQEDKHEREPITAFLRIRPNLNNDYSASQPYLTHLNDTSVRMSDPNATGQAGSRFRISTVPPSSVYTFSHIFPPDVTQSDFFNKTTLPMGQNGLLFTYGVTNSGKTFTIQGGNTEGSAGILPRTLDVMFNSIDGLHADGKVSLYLHPWYPLFIHRSIQREDYDLLDAVSNETTPASNIPRSNSNSSLLLTRTALNLRPSPSDDTGSDTPGKYISGLKQFRVHNATEAKALVKMGQLHRRVFGTLANRESSRSHGIVILKVVRGHRGERDDPTALQISRLTLVDLAGSERTKHTHTTGDRLKEAGNINKSLMVLGQCMEVMRSNQRRLAASLAHEGFGSDARMDTRDVKKGLALVPFRHSKLTELLMDYFVGDGRVVMIVNVNPYDTGYDENSHVMKFSALAREVYVTPAPAPMQRIPPTPSKLLPRNHKQLGRLPSRRTRREGGLVLPCSRFWRVSPIKITSKRGTYQSSCPKLFECELKCADIEAETREEVMKEMEERMRTMEKMYARRIMNESNIIEEVDVEIDLVGSGEEIVEESEDSDVADSRSPSPSVRRQYKSANKAQSKPATKVRSRATPPEGPAAVRLPSDEEDGNTTGTEGNTEDGDEEKRRDEDEDEEEGSNDEEEDDDDSDDWQPEEAPKAKPENMRPQTKPSVSKIKSAQVSALRESINSLSIEDPDELVAAPAAKKYRPRIENLDEDLSDEEEDIPKKKGKRYVIHLALSLEVLSSHA
ncbi:Kinesin protein [Salix suchowensis]|nr:Kinesin protein [Salix suchowensis]